MRVVWAERDTTESDNATKARRVDFISFLKIIDEKQQTVGDIHL